MPLRVRLLRLVAGLVLLPLLLLALFAGVRPFLHRWGATDAELTLALPGDDLLASPDLAWTNGVDIDAPPAAVWPWIAQLGDTRGGFYSYTFVENRAGALTGAADYAVVYRNADRVVPEWQHPAPGDWLIQKGLQVRDVRPGEWLLGASVDGGFGWMWLWHVAPRDGGARTRLLVRFRAKTPAEVANPVVTAVMDLGGFVMQQRMLHGLKLRAEGRREPAWTEGAEIAAWLAALVAGLAAAVLLVARRAWRGPLAAALVAVILLFVWTFAQPALWVRAVADLALLGWIAWMWARQARSGEPAPTPAP